MMAIKTKIHAQVQNGTESAFCSFNHRIADLHVQYTIGIWTNMNFSNHFIGATSWLTEIQTHTYSVRNTYITRLLLPTIHVFIKKHLFQE